MSHRDTDSRTTSVTHAQELSAAVQGLLGTIQWTNVRFRRDCRWTPMGLAVAALMWACSAKTTLGDRFEQALKLAHGLGRHFAPAQTSYQAFLKILVRWTAALRQDLVLQYHLLMERAFPDHFRIAGYVPFGGDGSKLQVARTRSNEARYSPAKTRARKGKKRRKTKRRKQSRQARAHQARAKKADSPQMALTLLHHLALRLPWDWRLGPSDASERHQLLDMIPHLPPDALVVADCGFYGYEFWSALLASKRQFVIRVGGNVRLLKKLGTARESNGTVYVWPDKVAKRNQPPLVLRLVEVHDGRQSWYLVTSVLHPKRLSDTQVAQIYGYRWRIELFFRHFKQTYGRAKLRSHKGEHAACEAEWSLLGLWTMLLHARLQWPDQDPGRLSVARVLRAFAQALDHAKWRPEPGASLPELLSRAVIDPYRRRDKTSRNYPRKKYEQPAGAPRILKATVTQRQNAHKLMTKAA
jgi:Transposase DDE domain